MIYTKVYKDGNEEIVKLKMYLRGLGMGIIGTVLILSLSGIHKEELSDDEIRAKALQLGMVDSKAVVLSEVDQVTSAEDEEVAEETGMTKEETTEEENPGGETTPTTEAVPTEESAPTEETDVVKGVSDQKELSEETQLPQENSVSQQESDSEKIAVLQIRAGSGSESISRQLEELGLVEDAKAFDQYLCNQGYARYLRIGTYEIPMGSSEEEIAKMLTGR